MSIGRLVSALVLLLTGVAGCTSGKPGPAPTPPGPASAGRPATASAGEPATKGQVAGCADSVSQVAQPSEDYRVVAGAVAVPVGERLLQPEKNSDAAGPTRLFAKWGLLVRTGTTVELSLLPGWSERARISWGDGAAEPGTAIRVSACPARTGEAWSVFTGGTWVAEPDCVPIRITSAQQQITVELSIGAPCSRPGG